MLAGVSAVVAIVVAGGSGQAVSAGLGSPGGSAARTRDPAAVLAHGSWRVLARSPIGSPIGASVVWDGKALLEVGGSSPGGQPRVLRTAAAFDPVTGRWRRIASVPSVVLPDGAATVWTGSRLFVFGGSEPPGPPPTGIAGLYDPPSNRWTTTPPAPVTLPSDNVEAVRSGTQVILAAVSGSGRHSVLHTVGYDPATNRWRTLPLSQPTGHDPLAVEMVATSDGVLLWSMWSRDHRVSPRDFPTYSGVDVFRLIDGRWRLATGTWPQHRTVDQPLFTGSSVLLGANQTWCGTCSHPPPFDANGWSVNPATLAVTKLPHGPFDDVQPQILWSGDAEIALNTTGEITGPHERVLRGDIAFLNPATRRWYQGSRAPRELGQLPAVWDGTHLLVLDQHGQILNYGPTQRSLK
jgi:Kelch motif